MAVLLKSAESLRSLRLLLSWLRDTSMNPARIPLFPLDIVLFPGQAVPLHIFEPRYRQMTRHCIDTQSPFGIVFMPTRKAGADGLLRDDCQNSEGI